VFQAIGGADEANLPVTWNDIDLCLRIREKGYRILMVPSARLFHLEQATRTPDASPENQEQLSKARAYIAQRHAGALRRDPFFNPQTIPEAAQLTLSTTYPYRLKAALGL